MKRNWLILSALAVSLLQIGFLTWTIAGRAAVLRDGREVLLQVQPIDPRDLLRGDYVILGYGFTQLPRTLFPASVTDADFEAGRAVYVQLKPGEGGVHTASAAAFDRAALAGDDPVIRGTLSYAQGGEGGLGAVVDYGIERFYLPEGDGKDIERDMRERPFHVVVALGPDGAAQVKRFLDGQTVLYEEPYY
jgi:uncharacterized membrane-anchored protein